MENNILCKALSSRQVELLPFSLASNVPDRLDGVLRKLGNRHNPALIHLNKPRNQKYEAHRTASCPFNWPTFLSQNCSSSLTFEEQGTMESHDCLVSIAKLHVSGVQINSRTNGF